MISRARVASSAGRRLIRVRAVRISSFIPRVFLPRIVRHWILLGKSLRKICRVRAFCMENKFKSSLKEVLNCVSLKLNVTRRIFLVEIWSISWTMKAIGILLFKLGFVLDNVYELTTVGEALGGCRENCFNLSGFKIECFLSFSEVVTFLFTFSKVLDFCNVQRLSVCCVQQNS